MAYDFQNIVLIRVDQLALGALGFMGNRHIRTPYLDRLAGQSLVFENAFTASPLCVPSRVGFFTGQYVHKTGAIDNSQASHIGLKQWSCVETLKQAGYKVGLAGKNHAFDDDYLDKWFDYREEYEHWGKTHGQLTDADTQVVAYRMDERRPGFADFTCDTMGLMEGLIEEAEPFPPEQCMTERIVADAITFMDKTAGEPFLLYCSFPDPHFPNIVCEPYHSMYAPDDLPDLPGMDIDWDQHPFKHYVQSQASGYDAYTTEQRKRILATYYAQVTFVDKAVGDLLGWLDKSGLSERTLIIFDADHGDFAGQFGLIGKTGGFFDCLIRIPLMMRIPGVRPARVAAQVSNIDVVPTVLDMLGLESAACVQGQSFLDVIEGKKSEHRKAVFSECGKPQLPPPAMDKQAFAEYARRRRQEDGVFWFCEYTTRGRSAMIRRGHWKYCFNSGDCEELYCLVDDPLEMINRAADPTAKPRLDELKNELLAWVLENHIAKPRHCS